MSPRTGVSKTFDHQRAGWFIVGVDDGTLGEIDAVEDRLTLTEEWIKTDAPMRVEQ